MERHWKQRATGIQWRIGQLFPLIGFFLCLGGERSPLRIGKSLGFACFYERHWKRRATGVQYRIGQLFVLIGFFQFKERFPPSGRKRSEFDRFFGGARSGESDDGFARRFAGDRSR